MKLFDEIKSVFFIDNKMNNILNDVNVNVRTIKMHFKILIDNLIIERIGSDKEGYWQILKWLLSRIRNLMGPLYLKGWVEIIYFHSASKSIIIVAYF